MRLAMQPVSKPVSKPAASVPAAETREKPEATPPAGNGVEMTPALQEMLAARREAG